MIAEYISVRNFCIALVLLILLQVYLVSIMDYITLTIQSYAPDKSKPDEVVPLRAVIPDSIFPARSSEYIYRQISFMGVSGRDWYLHFNLVDLVLFQQIATFVMLSAYQLSLRFLEENYKRGRKQKKGYFAWFYDAGLNLAACEWVADFVENLCAMTQTRMYPIQIPPVLNLLAIATTIKFTAAILLLVLTIIFLIRGSYEYFYAANKRIESLKKKK